MLEDLKREGKVRSWGISVNRWEPTNVLKALDSGLVDWVQVVYNIFDQNPEDELFPYCQRHGIAIIARVPFDEGSLTGTLTRDSTWPEGDWRNLYFTPENLAITLKKVAALTHGEYYAATSTKQLQRIYEHLSARMVIERSRTVEVTAFLIAVGALLLVVSAFCSVLWFNRVL